MIYERRKLAEARADLAAWLKRWQGKYAKLCDWVEENIEETLTDYRLPVGHHKHMRSTNLIERLNEEIRRRTYVVRSSPTPMDASASCERSRPNSTKSGRKATAT